MKRKGKMTFAGIILVCILVVYWFMPPFWWSSNFVISPLRFVVNPPKVAYSAVSHYFPVVVGYDRVYRKSPHQIIYVYSRNNSFWLRAQESYVLWKAGWEFMLDNNTGILKKGKHIGNGMCIKSIKGKTYISFTSPSEKTIHYPCKHIP